MTEFYDDLLDIHDDFYNDSGEPPHCGNCDVELLPINPSYDYCENCLYRDPWLADVSVS